MLNYETTLVVAWEFFRVPRITLTSGGLGFRELSYPIPIQFIIFILCYWCRGIWVRRYWAVKLYIDGAELLGAGRSAQDWQEIVIWPNWGKFWVRDSILVITLAMSVRFAHMTLIWKALFGVHVMATKPHSVRLVSSPKSTVFLSKNLILDIFFFHLW